MGGERIDLPLGVAVCSCGLRPACLWPLAKGGGNLADPATSRPRLRWLQHGDAVFHQGDATSDVYVVVSGAVVLTSLNLAGREAALGLLGPGRAFGQSTLVAGRQRGTARALGPSVVRVVDPGWALDHAVAPMGAPAAGVGARVFTGLDAALAVRCDALEEWVADLVLLDLPARLAKRLCQLLELVGRRVPEGILLDVPLTQGQLASLAAASREATNRTLGALTRAGVVGRLEHRYLVSDEDALRRMASREERALHGTSGRRRW